MTKHVRKDEISRGAVCFQCGGLIVASGSGPVAEVHNGRCRSRLRRWRSWLRDRCAHLARWDSWRGDSWPAAVQLAEFDHSVSPFISCAAPGALSSLIEEDLCSPDVERRIQALLIVRELGRGHLHHHVGWSTAAGVSDEIVRSWLGAA